MFEKTHLRQQRPIRAKKALVRNRGAFGRLIQEASLLCKPKNVKRYAIIAIPLLVIYMM